MRKTTAKVALLALVLVLVLGASVSASAAENFNYVEGGYGELDHGNTFFFNGAKDIDKNWGLVGGVEIGQYDPNFDFTLLEAGAQFHQPIDSRLNLNAGVKLLYVKVDGDVCIPGFGCYSASKDDTGVIANLGLRFQMAPKWQLEGDLKLSSNSALQNDGLGVQADVRYYIDPKLSVAGGLAVDTELDGLFASLRYDL